MFCSTSVFLWFCGALIHRGMNNALIEQLVLMLDSRQRSRLVVTNKSS